MQLHVKWLKFSIVFSFAKSVRYRTSVSHLHYLGHHQQNSDCKGTESSNMDEPSAGPSTVRGVIIRKPKKVRNVLTRMAAQQAGPLGVLQHCVEQRLKVKVWTRNYKHARGICNGYVVAFDKHWNLAMVDVEETYLNPLPVPANGVPKKRIRNRIPRRYRQSVPPSDDTSCGQRADVEHLSASSTKIAAASSSSASHSRTATDVAKWVADRLKEERHGSRTECGLAQTDGERHKASSSSNTLISPGRGTDLRQILHARVQARKSDQVTAPAAAAAAGEPSGGAAEKSHDERSADSRHIRIPGDRDDVARDDMQSRRCSQHESGGRQSRKDDVSRSDALSADRITVRESCRSNAGSRRGCDRTRASPETRRSASRRDGHSGDRDRGERANCREGRQTKCGPASARDSGRSSSRSSRERHEGRSSLRDAKSRDVSASDAAATQTGNRRVGEKDAPVIGKDSLTDATYQPILTRHVNQLFLRGDNVIFIAVCKE